MRKITDDEVIMISVGVIFIFMVAVIWALYGIMPTLYISGILLSLLLIMAMPYIVQYIWNDMLYKKFGSDN